MSTALQEVGGYENTFIDVPHERYMCKICLHPCHDAYLSGCCGHNFCKSCLDEFKRIARSQICPFCRNDECTTVPNKQADREIRSLQVMCTNKERGCEWQGELNDINSHLRNNDGCQFEDVKCSNECGKMLQRQYLTSHVENECPGRIVKCELCQVTGRHRFIEGEHKEHCPKLSLPCPNKCEVGSVPHEDMEAHRKECPLEMVQCEYHNVGCEERMMRKKKRNHEEERMEEHLLMIKLKLAKTEESLAATEAKLSSTDAKLFQTENKLAANETKLLSTETRLDSLEVMVHHLINTTGTSSNLIESIQWYSHLTTLTMTVTGITQVCPVIVKMSNFTYYKTRGINWYSEPFYSHETGYKLCLLVYPDGNGDGKGTHLSVYLNIMKGSHDDELTWPLRGKFEITLLNQLNNSEHCSRSVIINNDHRYTGRVTRRYRAVGGFGVSKFVSHEDLLKVTIKCQYLKETCVFFKINLL
ncbi:TNF receptor-associated factor 4-like [Dysidea avara]|uniref:TNF receptor-associated factor 4-like n=1 Tax=Dysidea avara TaxID=196820 RepID=UPI00331D1F21